MAKLESVAAMVFGMKMVMKIGFICEITMVVLEMNELANVNDVQIHIHISYMCMLHKLKHENVCVCVRAHCKYNIEHQDTKTK